MLLYDETDVTSMLRKLQTALYTKFNNFYRFPVLIWLRMLNERIKKWITKELNKRTLNKGDEAVKSTTKYLANIRYSLSDVAWSHDYDVVKGRDWALGNLVGANATTLYKEPYALFNWQCTGTIPTLYMATDAALA